MGVFILQIPNDPNKNWDEFNCFNYLNKNPKQKGV